MDEASFAFLDDLGDLRRQYTPIQTIKNGIEFFDGVKRAIRRYSMSIEENDQSPDITDSVVDNFYRQNTSDDGRLELDELDDGTHDLRLDDDTTRVKKAVDEIWGLVTNCLILRGLAPIDIGFYPYLSEEDLFTRPVDPVPHNNKSIPTTSLNDFHLYRDPNLDIGVFRIPHPKSNLTQTPTNRLRAEIAIRLDPLIDSTKVGTTFYPIERRDATYFALHPLNDMTMNSIFESDMPFMDQFRDGQISFHDGDIDANLFMTASLERIDHYGRCIILDSVPYVRDLTEWARDHNLDVYDPRFGDITNIPVESEPANIIIPENTKTRTDQFARLSEILGVDDIVRAYTHRLSEYVTPDRTPDNPFAREFKPN